MVTRSCMPGAEHGHQANLRSLALRATGISVSASCCYRRLRRLSIMPSSVAKSTDLRKALVFEATPPGYRPGVV